MTQTKLESTIETIANVGSGLLLSALIIQPLLFPIFDIHTSTTENLMMASIFTAVSVARGYIWRRFFNHRLHLKSLKRDK